MRFLVYILLGFAVLVVATSKMPEYNFQYDQKGVCEEGKTPQLITTYIVCK